MTSWTTEYDELTTVLEASIDTMTNEGLQPRDWEVSIDNGELWANVWFDTTSAMTLDEQKTAGMEVIKDALQEHDTQLPLTVNANYQTDAVADGIACWWHAP